MRNEKRLFVICIILGCFVSICMMNQVWGKDNAYIPAEIVIDRSITNETEKFEVYTGEKLSQSGSRFDKGYLYIKDGKRTVFKKKYSLSGVYVVNMPRQKAGVTLNIFIRSDRAESSHLKIKVKDIKKITGKKYSSKIKSPGVKRSTVDGGAYITGSKGMNVIIQTENRVIRKIHYNKDGKKFISWNRSFDGETIYIYAVENKYRSKIQCIPIIYKVPDEILY